MSSAEDTIKKTCCCSRCYKTNGCCCLPIGVYTCRSRKDTLLMLSFTGLIVSLLVAFALPAIVQVLLDEGIAGAVVMVPGNPNLNAWETNVKSDNSRRRLDADSTDDVSTDDKLHYDLYFFNLTNPNEVLNGAKPNVTQLGPYSHTEYYQKFDVSWSDSEEEVSYNNYKYYIYDENRSQSGLTIDDDITLTNPVVIGFQYIMEQLPVNTTELVQIAIEKELSKFYQKAEGGLQKVKDEIDKRHIINKDKKKVFDAQVDDIMNGITQLYTELDSFITNSPPTDLLLKVILGKSPNGITPFFKQKPGPAYFGWLNDSILLEVQSILNLVENKTNTNIPWTSAVPGSVANYTSLADARRRKGKNTMKTGKNDVSVAGDLVLSEGMPYVWGCTNAMASQNMSDYKEGYEFPSCENFDSSWNDTIAISKGYSKAWATSNANLVSGSSGEIFHPDVSETYTNIFISDIYRGASLEHTSDIDWYGVNLYRLTIQHQDMLNSTTYPPNADYYSNGPMGLLNMTAATGAPAFGSYPHFLMSDQRLIDSVDGMEPNYGKHMTYLDVEPNTGLLACARKQLQTNYYLSNQTFPKTTFNFKGEVQTLCANISTLLQELKQDPLPCDDLDQVNEIFDILAQDAGWKIRENGLEGNGIYMPYAWSSEYMTLPQDDAVAIQSEVYAAQDMEEVSFQWGLMSSGIFGLLTFSLIFNRYLQGEKLRNIILGGPQDTSDQYEKYEDKSEERWLSSDGDLTNPLINSNDGMRDSHF